MSERSRWEELKVQRANSESRQAGYRDAADAVEFGIRIRCERERLGLTQAGLADRMKTTQPVVARLEAGGVTPSLETLRKAADALGLDLIVDFRQRTTPRNR
jgi:ribosome-binding protein aMBF1 (putative translation factor)